MENEVPNQDKLNELLLPFIDKGFLNFFPDVKADLLHTFIQSLGQFYHMDKTDPMDRPGAGTFVDFFKVLDLLMLKKHAKYIPDFFLAISSAPPLEKSEQDHVVMPEQRLSASLYILQLDQIMEKIMHSKSWVPNKQVGKSLFVVRNNLVVSYGLPSLAKQSDIKQLATDIKLTVKPYITSSENTKKTKEEELQDYLDKHDSIFFGEAELHIQASDQIRIQRRVDLFSK